MPEHIVTRADLDLERRKIARAGKERLVSIVPIDDGDMIPMRYTITTELLDEPPVEIR